MVRISQYQDRQKDLCGLGLSRKNIRDLHRTIGDTRHVIDAFDPCAEQAKPDQKY
jgi:hypothetical protein